MLAAVNVNLRESEVCNLTCGEVDWKAREAIGRADPSKNRSHYYALGAKAALGDGRKCRNTGREPHPTADRLAVLLLKPGKGPQPTPRSERALRQGGQPALELSMCRTLRGPWRALGEISP
jgi:hypothetical protein